MKIAWISDIHGNLAALEAVHEDLILERVDVVVNLGDALSGPLLALDTARWLSTRNHTGTNRPRWLHIAGNHERQLLAAAAHLKQGLQPPRPNDSDHLAATQLDADSLNWVNALVLSTHAPLHQGSWHPELLGPDVAMCHGTPGSDLIYLLDTPEGEAMALATEAEIKERLGSHVPDHITLLACGHSHLPRHVELARLAGTLQLVNPGSVGLQAYDDDDPYPRSSYHRVENGDANARYAITESGTLSRTWNVRLRNVCYDAEPMARVAELAGRPDWAHALRTGSMPRSHV